MATIADLLVKVGVDADDSALDGFASSVDDNFGKIALGGAAAGLAMEGFARSQKPLSESVQRTAAALGESESAIRDLALETTNVTFPLGEVVDLFELARQQGATTGAELQSFANFWDMVGDAPGASGVELGQAGVALRALGIELGNESEALSAFGFITDSTTQDVGDFLRFIERTGPQLREMGLDVDDTAAIMGVLEGELGLTARTARTEFRKAVNEADGDLGAMFETLGISAEQFDTYRGAVDDASDVIERNAAIHAESFTPIERMRQKAEELMFQFGSLADVAGALALPLMALGPILKLVTSGFLGLFKVLLLNPFVLIAVAVIALAVVIVKNWDTIKSAIGKAWNAIKGATVAAWNFLKSIIGKAVDFIVKMFLNFTVPGLIIKHWDTIRRVTTTAWNAVVSFIRGIPGRIVSGLSRLGSMVANLFRNVINGGRTAFRNGVTSLISFVRQIPSRIVRAIPNPGRMLLNIGKQIIQGLINGIKNMMGSLGNAVGGIGGFIKSLKGPEREDRKMLIPEGIAIMDGLIGGIARRMPELRSLLGDVSGDINTGINTSLQVPRIATPAASPTVIELRGDGSQRAEFLVSELRALIKSKTGGDVQLALGGRRQ
jgi:hypothetical protein